MAIAALPHSPTRSAARERVAPPAWAPAMPSSTRAMSDAAMSAGTRLPPGAMSKVSTGTMAPKTKLNADESAACTGRARVCSWMPNSSRAWASMGSCAHQRFGDLRCEFGGTAPAAIDRRQFVCFACGVICEFVAFASQIAEFGIAL